MFGDDRSAFRPSPLHTDRGMGTAFQESHGVSDFESNGGKGACEEGVERGSSGAR